MKFKNKTIKLISYTFILILMMNIVFINNFAKAEDAKTQISIENKEVVQEQFTNPSYLKEKAYFYHLKGTTSKMPVIFFCHGYGGTDPNLYKDFINHIVNQGYVLVYVPYPIIPLPISDTIISEKYNILWTGIEESVKQYGNLMDLTKIGFVGHSFGAGAIPSLTYKAVKNNNWGKSGAFMYMLAPWYSYGITQEQLENFPQDVKLLVEVFNDDATNDHRMAKDIFQNISIKSSEKDFVNLYSSYNSDLVAPATHMTPLNSDYDLNSYYTTLDKYGIYKLFDGLAKYSFNKDLEGKNIALGNGSKEQVYMGTWSDGTNYKELYVTDSPVLTRPQIFYKYRWDSFLNPRKSLTNYTDEDDNFIHITKEFISKDKEWKVNFNSKINAASLDGNSINLYNSSGDTVPFNMKVTDDDKSIVITSVKPYTYGETYTLYVNKGIISSSNTSLNKGYIVTFKIS